MVHRMITMYLGVHKHSKEVQSCRGGRPRHGKGFSTEDNLRPVLEKDAHADGADHNRQETPVAQGIVCDTLKDDAEDAHEDYGDHAGQRPKGIFMLLISHTATKAGTIANSPWAKLTTFTALKIRTNPSATRA